MAVFADLDLRAGSDLKALRGLVETAAHRESTGFALSPYHPALFGSFFQAPFGSLVGSARRP